MAEKYKNTEDNVDVQPAVFGKGKLFIFLSLKQMSKDCIFLFEEPWSKKGSI